MRRMETWTDALTGLYNSCLTAPCRGHDSPPLPETAPERPPLPLLYTEFQFYKRRHGFRHTPVAQEGHHSVEWNRGAITDRGQNGVAHQVVKREQRSNQYSHHQNNNVLSRSEAPRIRQLFEESSPRVQCRGQALSRWSTEEWTHGSEGYLSVEMDSPVTPTRTGRSRVETPDSESEYFTPRVTPQALRRQDASPSQQRRLWARFGPQAPLLDPAQGFYYHTLPVPRCKTLVPKPRLCISPQGLKISVVEKPMSMRATITPTSPPNASPPSQHHFHPIQHHMKMQPSNTHPLTHWQQSQGGSGPQQTQRFVHQPAPVKPHRYLQSGTIMNEHTQSEHRDKAMVGNAGSSAGPNSQVDVKTNVFGQPLLSATRRTGQSPLLTRRTQVEEDLRKLLVVGDTVDHGKVTNIDGTLSSLQNIDGTLDQYPGDSADVPHSPTMAQPQGSPARAHSRASAQLNRNGFGSVSELSDTSVWNMKPFRETHSPVPPPGTLVPPSVKDKMASICTTSEYQEMGTVPESNSVSQGPPEMLLEDSTMQQGEDSGELARQLYYLETILGELKSDLNKERRDKLVLLAEVESLRKNNHHLLEESLFAYEELHKLKSMFSVAPGDVQ
ncbi:uncharacterized protein LOC121709994 isoform X2 [Alosa sapidissima]|uniref:uncharacterized protein LOC121709994 isoform X2 n=1 Tax=Alosa sapidissima TaxID=34773 RepID=UPI001C0973BC|nr:uncharacterized protein LOC121709994 isoform X2 [Alosa sapidissima]